jgi:hypothetical protein
MGRAKGDERTNIYLAKKISAGDWWNSPVCRNLVNHSYGLVSVINTNVTVAISTMLVSQFSFSTVLSNQISTR